MDPLVGGALITTGGGLLGGLLGGEEKESFESWKRKMDVQFEMQKELERMRRQLPPWAYNILARSLGVMPGPHGQTGWSGAQARGASSRVMGQKKQPTLPMPQAPPTAGNQQFVTALGGR